MQPHSGAQANMAAYSAILEPGDTVMGMSLDKLQIPALPFKLRLHCFADLRVVFGDESYRIKIIGKHLCTSFSAG